MATDNFRERCRAEATANVIFLFQWRRYIVTGVPDGYDYIDESVCKSEDFDQVCDQDHGEELTVEQLAELTYAIETWETDRVFLSREEATEYGKRRGYDYRDGWRVYGIPAAGELVQLLATT